MFLELTHNKLLFISDTKKENRSDTPPSPDCGLDHLDIDCKNHVCPCLVEKKQTIFPLRSQSSTASSNSAQSTPQTNIHLASIISTPTQTLRPRLRHYASRKDTCNVRRRRVSEWIDTKRKIMKNLGKEYKSRKGTVRAAKKMHERCLSTCRVKCSEKITEDERQHVFETFWALGDQNKQREYIAKLATKQKKRRGFTDTESRRKFTIKYRLPKYQDENKELVEVCKKMFLATFSISERFVFTAFDKFDNKTGILKPDLRGRHKNRNLN